MRGTVTTGGIADSRQMSLTQWILLTGIYRVKVGSIDLYRSNKWILSEYSHKEYRGRFRIVNAGTTHGSTDSLFQGDSKEMAECIKIILNNCTMPGLLGYIRALGFRASLYIDGKETYKDAHDTALLKASPLPESGTLSGVHNKWRQNGPCILSFDLGVFTHQKCSPNFLGQLFEIEVPSNKVVNHKLLCKCSSKMQIPQVPQLTTAASCINVPVAVLAVSRAF